MSQVHLYQLAEQTSSQMMSYIVHTGSGRLIVIDGGMAGDASYLLETLQQISGNEKPTVDAWLLSHPHADHIDALMELCEYRAEEISIEQIYHHFPAADFLAEHEPQYAHTIAAYEELRPQLKPIETVVSAGQRITVDDVTFDVLYTTNPAYTMNAGNNASTVFAMSAEGCRMMFLGDLGEEAGAELLARHGDALRSDIVQMAHHGQNGVRLDVYRAIAPQLCLWPTPAWLWDNDLNEGGRDSGPWKTLEVRKWMDEIGVHRHVVGKDGTARITLNSANVSVATS